MLDACWMMNMPMRECCGCRVRVVLQVKGKLQLCVCSSAMRSKCLNSAKHQLRSEKVDGGEARGNCSVTRGTIKLQI